MECPDDSSAVESRLIQLFDRGISLSAVNQKRKEQALDSYLDLEFEEIEQCREEFSLGLFPGGLVNLSAQDPDTTVRRVAGALECLSYLISKIPGNNEMDSGSKIGWYLFQAQALRTWAHLERMGMPYAKPLWVHRRNRVCELATGWWLGPRKLSH